VYFKAFGMLEAEARRHGGTKARSEGEGKEPISAKIHTFRDLIAAEVINWVNDLRSTRRMPKRTVWTDKSDEAGGGFDPSNIAEEYARQRQRLHQFLRMARVISGTYDSGAK